MSHPVELISTGTELLNGRVLNSHAQTLARVLTPLGLRLERDTTLPDDRAAIRAALEDALRRVDVVFLSGGLGPTSDDVTREAVADVLAVPLVMHEPSRQAIRDRYARQQRPLNDSVERHARVLQGAEVLPNSAGLAPGEEVPCGGKRIYLLPGPPAEFLAVLTEQVVPRLARWRPGEPSLTAVFQVCGIGESDLVSRLGEGFPGPGVDVAYCASVGRVEVRLWAPPARREALAAAAACVREKAGDHVYSEGEESLEEVIGALCRARGLSLAVAESCTGGLVAHRLTNVSGSSAYFLGGVVAYANEAKVRDLDVPADLLARVGAVSPEVARAMAEGVRRRFGAGCGLAITGIAGPTGGTAAKPVGLVYLAVADGHGVSSREHRLVGSRLFIKEWSAQMALDHLRRRLRETV